MSLIKDILQSIRSSSLIIIMLKILKHLIIIPIQNIIVDNINGIKSFSCIYLYYSVTIRIDILSSNFEYQSIVNEVQVI